MYLPFIKKVGSNFEGSEFNLFVTETGTGLDNSTTGSTTGLTTEFSGASYADVENKIVALLRSRGSYDANEVLNLEIAGSTDIGYVPSVDEAATAPKGNFSISGTSVKSGQFSYSLSFDNTKKNYITRSIR